MKILGIDVGTANTYMFMADEDRPQAPPEPVLLPGIGDSSGSMASAVLYEEDRPILAGNIAESEYYANAAARKKRRLATMFKPELAQGEPGAMRGATDFLRILGGAFFARHDPADFRIYAGQPTLAREDFSVNLGACFVEAGWPRPLFARESDAALVSCVQSGALNIADLERRCFILDFGGGTCDFTSVENLDNLHCGGDILYGGRLFDDLFFQIFQREDRAFAKEAPNSPAAWYIHWVECKREKEKFSDFLARLEKGGDGPDKCVLAISWIDAKGRRRESFVPAYGREEFIRDAEHYRASPEMLALLREYSGRGGLSSEARDLLEGRETPLLSWLRGLLESVDRRGEVARAILTGGSCRWPFVAELIRRVFPAAACVLSGRGFEDIAYGLALYPMLSESREKTARLLTEKIDSFTARAVKKARDVAARAARQAAVECARRMVRRDIMPVLEAAAKNGASAESLEAAFMRNIEADFGLLEIIRERSEALSAEIQAQLNFDFGRWLRENGVSLAPRFDFHLQAIGDDFFDGLSVGVSRLDSLNLMGFFLSKIFPLLAGAAAAGAIAHTAEPVSTVLGGGMAMGGTWLAAKFAPGFLRRRKLPAFLLGQATREKILNKNQEYVEKFLTRAFAERLSRMDAEIERKLREALEGMLARLSALNQIQVN